MLNKRSAIQDFHSIEIHQNGKPLNQAYHIRSVMIKKEINHIASARLHIADGDPINGGYDINDSEDLIPGVEIEVKMGYRNRNETVFKGIVVKNSLKSMEHGIPVLIVDCKDEAYKLSIHRNHRFFQEVKESEAIEQIASEYQLKSDLEETAVTHSELIQFDISDWEWIVKRADRNGMVIILKDGEVSLKTPKVKPEADYEFTFSENILEIEAELESRYQYGQVATQAWNENEQDISTTESNIQLTEHGDITSQQLAEISGIRELTLVNAGSIRDEELQILADARAQKSQMAKIRGTIKVLGFSEIQVGDTISLEKLSGRFNGNSFVSGISHQINQDIWETYIQFGMPEHWWGEQPESSKKSDRSDLNEIDGLHIGLVVKLADDQNQEKIKVQIPAIDNQMDGVWARMSNLYAGEQRGVIFRPEVGDEVILGFLDNDPEQPIILGQLHSNAYPSPIPNDDENPEKGIVLRQGLKLIFNEKDSNIFLGIAENTNLSQAPGLMIAGSDSEITLQDANDNQIKLSAEGIALISKGKIALESEAEVSVDGKEIGITADKLECMGKQSMVINSNSQIDIG